MILFNSFRFYGRITSVFFKHNKDVLRFTRVLNTFTQVVLLVTLLALMIQEGKARKVTILILWIFLIMRFTQIILTFGLSKTATAPKWLKILYIVFLFILNGISQAVLVLILQETP